MIVHDGRSSSTERKVERRTRQRAANRAAILDAARRVAAKTELGEIALRAVAAEAGYAPASVYEYFRNRAELVLALAADDLGAIARALKEPPAGDNRLAAAAARGTRSRQAQRRARGLIVDLRG